MYSTDNYTGLAIIVAVELDSPQGMKGRVRSSTSAIFGISIGGAVLLAFLIIHFRSASTSLKVISLQRAKETPAELSAMEGERVVSKFLLRNNSPEAIELTELSTSCPCLAVESPTSLPLIIGADEEIPVVTSLTIKPTFSPVKLSVSAKVRTSENTKIVDNGFLFHGWAKYRTLPTVVTFGEVDRHTTPRSVSVIIFENVKVDHQAKITSASTTTSAISVKLVDEASVTDPELVPKHYREIGVVRITLDPRNAEGPLRGNADITFANGADVNIPVTAYVN